jgi:hypothetical protein
MRREETLKNSRLHLLLVHQMLDHEFTAQQAARIIRNLPQPLFEGDLLFGPRLRSLRRRRIRRILILGGLWGAVGLALFITGFGLGR